MSQPQLKQPHDPFAQPARDFQAVQGGGRAPVVLAGLGERFLALFIDAMIVGFGSVVLSFVVGLGLGVAGVATETVAAVAGFVCQLGFTIWYYGHFYSTAGASPGKKMMGLRVVDVQSGQNLTFGRAVLRETVGRVLSAILLIGYIMAMVRSDKRALHDLMVGSGVVKGG